MKLKCTHRIDFSVEPGRGHEGQSSHQEGQEGKDTDGEPETGEISATSSTTHDYSSCEVAGLEQNHGIIGNFIGKLSQVSFSLISLTDCVGNIIYCWRSHDT